MGAYQNIKKRNNIGRCELILSFLVSNLILNYTSIVASRSYVDKLSPVSQSSVFKRRTVIALK